VNVNVVVVTGNLTRDPELKQIQSGTALCKLRIAVNDRYKDQNGEWTDRPNYFSVDAWGNLAERCAEYLAKGKKVAVTGKLQWREWDATDGSGKRSEVSIRADNVEFLSPRGDAQDAGNYGGDHYEPVQQAGGGGEFPSAASDDDIPF
jgi:single-strand DNA-binding protein